MQTNPEAMGPVKGKRRHLVKQRSGTKKGKTFAGSHHVRVVERNRWKAPKRGKKGKPKPGGKSRGFKAKGEGA